VKLQPVLTSQALDELLIRIRLPYTQLVIEMNDGKNNPQLTPQLQQQPQKRNRVNPTGHGNADAVPSPQQFMPPNVSKHALRQ
jgi:hypothetical protein